MMDTPSKRNIHASLLAAMAEAAAVGIAKTSVASLGGGKINYRGIEAAMNTMCGILVHNGITVTPSYHDLAIVDRVRGLPADGKFSRAVTIRGIFTFAAEDGTKVECSAYGEAADTGDKAVTKAQSVAFRTALFQQFVIPTVAMDPEADDTAEDLIGAAEEAADGGEASYIEFFTQTCTAEQRTALKDEHKRLKIRAMAC